jgi:hypothetical protein
MLLLVWLLPLDVAPLLLGLLQLGFHHRRHCNCIRIDDSRCRNLIRNWQGRYCGLLRLEAVVAVLLEPLLREAALARALRPVGGGVYCDRSPRSVNKKSANSPNVTLHSYSSQMSNHIKGVLEYREVKERV